MDNTAIIGAEKNASKQNERGNANPIKRGDMFYANLSLGLGSEQYGFRPVLIIQNNKGNAHSRTVIVATITSKVYSKARLPTHCPLKPQQRLRRGSLVMLEQIRTIDKRRLQEYIGTLNADAMTNVDRALAVSVGLNCEAADANGVTL